MHTIKKAIIPVAGLATRIYPMNKVTKKAFLPIIDKDSRVKPVILKLVEELCEADIEEIYIIIGNNDKILYDNLFKNNDSNVYNKLSKEDKEYEKHILEIGKKVKYIIQKEPLGFAHAVYLAKEVIQDEPCILILGDTIYKSNQKENCIEQILNFYDQYKDVIISIQKLKPEQLKYYGIINGTWDNEEKTIISLNTIVEKPSIEYAKEYLLQEDNGTIFYGNFGMFILTKKVFEELEKVMQKSINENEEHQLMDAFENVIKKGQVKGLVINGSSYDVGNIEAYTYVQRNF